MLFSKPSLLPSFLFGFQCPRCAFPRQLLHNITGFFRCQQIFSSFSKLFSDLSASGVFARSSTEVDSKYNIFRQQFQGVCKKFYTIALFSERNGAASVERKRRPCSIRTRRSAPGRLFADANRRVLIGKAHTPSAQKNEPPSQQGLSSLTTCAVNVRHSAKASPLQYHYT